jgi:hypothetical protein
VLAVSSEDVFSDDVDDGNNGRENLVDDGNNNREASTYIGLQH